MKDKYEKIKQYELLRKKRKNFQKAILSKKIRELTDEERNEAIALIEKEFDYRKKSNEKVSN